MDVSTSTVPSDGVSWKFRLIWAALAAFFLNGSTVDCQVNIISPRIIHGSPVLKPSTVSFFARPARDEFQYTTDSLCGATLIHSDILVTAAHCHGAFHHGALMLDAVSSNDSFTHKIMIDRQVRHPQWDYYGRNNEGALNYDVLLLRLETPNSLNDPIIQPISFNMDPSIPRIGDDLTIYGLGRTETGSTSQELRYAIVQYISNENCTQRFRHNGVNITPVAEEFICSVQPNNTAVDISTCKGDSGGPVTVELTTTDETGRISKTKDIVLVGVISGGVRCSTDEFPNGHARISSVASWMHQEICRISHQPPDDCQLKETKPVDSIIAILLSITFDFFPQETLYAIRSVSDQLIVHTGPEIVAKSNSQVNTTLYLIPGQYTMEVYDTYGNGMTGRDNTPADPTYGGWELFAENDNDSTGPVLLAKGDGNFTRRQVTTFEVLMAMDSDETSTDPDRDGITIAWNLTMDECLLLQRDPYYSDDVTDTSCECRVVTTATSNLHNQLFDWICSENSTNVNECSLQYHPCQTSEDCCQKFYCINDLCVRGRGHGNNNSDKKKDNRLGKERQGSSDTNRHSLGKNHHI
jgi:hypothetical protein